MRMLQELKKDILTIKNNLTKNILSFEIFDRYVESNLSTSDLENTRLLNELYAEQLTQFVKNCKLVSRIAKTDRALYEIYRRYLKDTIIGSLLRDNDELIKQVIHARWLWLIETFIKEGDITTATLIRRTLDPNSFTDDPIKIKSEKKEDPCSISKADFNSLIETLEKGHDNKIPAIICINQLCHKVDAGDESAIESYIKKLKYLDAIFSRNKYLWDQFQKLHIFSEDVFPEVALLIGTYDLKDDYTFVLKVKSYIQLEPIENPNTNDNEIKKLSMLADDLVKREKYADAAAFYYQALIMDLSRKIVNENELESLYFLSLLNEPYREETITFGIDDLLNELLEMMINHDRKKINSATTLIGKIESFNKIFFSSNYSKKQTEIMSLYESLTKRLAWWDRQILSSVMFQEKKRKIKPSSNFILAKGLAFLQTEKSKKIDLPLLSSKFNKNDGISKTSLHESDAEIKKILPRSPAAGRRSIIQQKSAKVEEKQVQKPQSHLVETDKKIPIIPLPKVVQAIVQPETPKKMDKKVIINYLDKIEAEINKGHPSFQLIDELIKPILKLQSDELAYRRFISLTKKAIELAAKKLVIRDAILFDPISDAELRVRIARDESLVTKLTFSDLYNSESSRADTHYIIKDLSKSPGVHDVSEVYTFIYVDMRKIEHRIPLTSVPGLSGFLASLPPRKDKEGKDKFFEDDVETANSLIKRYRDTKDNRIPNLYYDTFLQANRELMDTIQEDIRNIESDQQLLQVRINRYILIALKAFEMHHAFNLTMNIAIVMNLLKSNNPELFDDNASWQKLDHFLVGNRVGYPNIKNVILNHTGAATPFLIPFKQLYAFNSQKVDDLQMSHPELVQTIVELRKLTLQERDVQLQINSSQLTNDAIEEINIVLKSDAIIQESLACFERFKLENKRLLEKTEEEYKKFDLSCLYGAPSEYFEMQPINKEANKTEKFKSLLFSISETVVFNPLYGRTLNQVISSRKVDNSMQMLSYEEFLQMESESNLHKKTLITEPLNDEMKGDTKKPVALNLPSLDPLTTECIPINNQVPEFIEIKDKKGMVVRLNVQNQDERIPPKVPPLELGSVPREKVGNFVTFFNSEIKRCSPRPLETSRASARNRSKMSEDMRNKLRLFLPQIAQSIDAANIEFVKQPLNSARKTPRPIISSRDKLADNPASCDSTPRREMLTPKASPKKGSFLPMKKINKSPRNGSSLFKRTKLKQTTSEIIRSKVVEDCSAQMKKAISFNYGTKVSENTEQSTILPLITVPKL